LSKREKQRARDTKYQLGVFMTNMAPLEELVLVNVEPKEYIVKRSENIFLIHLLGLIQYNSWMYPLEVGARIFLENIDLSLLIFLFGNDASLNLLDPGGGVGIPPPYRKSLNSA
jgi:hypothetical protein